MSAPILASQKLSVKPTTAPEGSEPSVERGTVVDKDVDLLEQIGYKQVCKALNTFVYGDKAEYKKEFRREFTRWSTLSYAASVMGVLGSGRLVDSTRQNFIS